MSPRLDLSIVIVNWNTREMLRDCLTSVRAGLRGITAEVVVVDNASTDGSAGMVADAFPEVTLIRNAENRGFAAANNQAFELARGRHILLLNSDTLVHGTVLADSVGYLDAHPKAGAMGCRVLNTDGSVQLTCRPYPSLLILLYGTLGLYASRWPGFVARAQMNDWQRDSARPVDMITGCYLMLRREVLDTVGPLDEAFFFFGEETDWCRRMRSAGWELWFAPVGEITHHGSVSAKKLNYRRGVLLTEALVRLHRKHGGWAAAACAWVILAGFNISRALFWSLLAPLGGTRARERARHFVCVAVRTAATWP